MSDVVRLTLVSHAMTDAMTTKRFPADEPVNALGHRQLATLRDVTEADARAFCGPEKRTRQTAALLGLKARTEARLADLNCGHWRGAMLDDVPPAQLAVWLSEPARAPHGGESVLDLVDRVAGWLDLLTAHPGRIVAVTHPAVIRAAIVTVLDAKRKSFWRIDIGPATRTVLHHRANVWTLRCGQ